MVENGENGGSGEIPLDTTYDYIRDFCDVAWNFGIVTGLEEIVEAALELSSDPGVTAEGCRCDITKGERYRRTESPRRRRLAQWRLCVAADRLADLTRSIQNQVG